MDKLYVENYKDGRFRYIFRYYDPMTDSMKRVTCVKDKNTRQTYNLALRELQEKAYRITNDYKSYTLKMAAEAYEKDKSKTIKASTLKRNMITVNQVNNKIGNDVLLKKINVPTVKNALNELSTTNVMFNEKLHRYKAFLNWCYENEYTENKFWDKIRSLPDNKKERISDKYLESDEITVLLKSMESNPLWYYVTYFLILSGLRIGELIALEDKDVGDYIIVDKTCDINSYVIGTPKTIESNREVYVQTELRELIRKIKLYRKEYCFSKGIRTNLFICGSDGSYFNYYSYNKYLKQHSKNTIGRTITPHALRHTSASLLLEKGVPLESIAKRLGHANSDITKDIYIHMTEKMKKKEEERLQDIRMING
ncbi:MAG: site-specific integrase [Eubacterium sp.]|nr:site-specific integrase [Eubacterium sp.]